MLGWVEIAKGSGGLRQGWSGKGWGRDGTGRWGCAGMGLQAQRSALAPPAVHTAHCTQRGGGRGAARGARSAPGRQRMGGFAGGSAPPAWGTHLEPRGVVWEHRCGVNSRGQ